jgi:2-polyprenyl-3-methyl-5-hydroxy-6-metoxy-1,4-benzoquinol methylase
MSDNASEFEYTGTDNLEVMAEAVNYNRFLVDLVETYGAGANDTLDFGAGIGTFSEMVRERNRSVDCLEMDPRLGDVLQEKGFKNFLRSEDIADASYDYIYSLNVFEHIKDDHAAAREAHRILRPGGTLFIYVPAFSMLFGSMDRKVEHFRRYTRSSLTNLIVSANFNVETNYYVDALGFFASLAYNIVSRGDGSLNRSAVRFYDQRVFPVSRMIDRVTSAVIGKNAVIVARK